LHERVLNILACKYVDDVIIGAPFKITEKFVKDLNISVVVKGLHVQQGGIKSEALDLKPYEYAKEKDILTEVDINCTITMKEIVDRILLNKEAITQKVMKSTTKQELYEKNSKFISEIR
jgi:ethanolamine-phosphate cytidylyltransferase